VPVIRFMSCDLRVLMDQPAESISSRDPSSRRDDRWFGGAKRWGLPQGAVRAVAVVMVDISGQHPPQLPTAHDQHPIQQLTRTVPTHRSAKALARGARTGVPSTLIPSAANTASNAAVNFASRSGRETGTGRRGPPSP
jgi:hypothetical protein